MFAHGDDGWDSVPDMRRRFVEAATVDGREARARAMLAEQPELAAAGLDCALVVGDHARVEAAIAREPGLAQRAIGARGWLPLMYACHTCFAEDRADGVYATVRLLLAAGAGPN